MNRINKPEQTRENKYTMVSRHNQAQEQEQEIREVGTALSQLLSADSTFAALKATVNELSNTAPEDNDVLIHAFNITVTKVRYVKPHTFIFEGYDAKRHPTFVACHFSQLVAHVVYVPKRTNRPRIITGFASDRTS